VVSKTLLMRSLRRGDRDHSFTVLSHPPHQYKSLMTTTFGHHCKCVGAGYSVPVDLLALLDGDSQLDPVVWRVNQILLRAQVPVGRLYGCMPQQHLDLFEFVAGGAA
jgi:hypothetical protein